MKFKKYILTEEADKFLRAIEESPHKDRFIVGDIPPATKDETHYYIGTGMMGSNYTLRYNWLEVYHYRTSPTSYSVSLRPRDNYILNLSPKPETAIEKAVAYLKQNEKIYYSPFELHKRAEARDTDIIKFGKHSGKSLYDMVKENPRYVAWMAIDTFEDKGFLNKPKYNAFKNLLSQVAKDKDVAPFIDAELEKREKKARDAEIEKELAKDRIEKFRPIVDVLKQVKYESDFIKSMVDTLKAGENIQKRWSPKVFSIVADVYAKTKSEGARRGSKDYEAARSEFLDIVEKSAEDVPQHRPVWQGWWKRW